MLLADFIFVWVGGALVVGVVGLLTLVFTALGRMIRAFWRAVSGARRAGPADGTLERPCDQPRCGHVNRAGARYCARCGRPLATGHDEDRYG